MSKKTEKVIIWESQYISFVDGKKHWDRAFNKEDVMWKAIEVQGATGLIRSRTIKTVYGKWTKEKVN
jgi:hypothetical protein